MLIVQKIPHELRKNNRELYGIYDNVLDKFLEHADGGLYSRDTIEGTTDLLLLGVFRGLANGRIEIVNGVIKHKE